ncbi:MAG: MFS transporter [bacterium]|nr:MFS transporter [bacterium]
MTQGSSSGIRTFAIILVGQLVSLFGSGLARFALGVWVFQKTGSATQFALMSFAAMIPGTLVTPLGGVLADRWNRRRIMIGGDCLAGLTTAVLVCLVWLDTLIPWHLYAIIAINAAASALQGPAFAATTPLLLPKRHLGRAAGVGQAGYAASRILTPTLAAVLLVAIGLHGILVVDLVTLVFAVGTLLIVRIPQPPRTVEGEESRGSLLQEMVFGLRYVWRRRGLMALLILLAGAHYMVGTMQVLLTPLILSFASPTALGTVLSCGAVGFLTGSVVMGVWGGPQRRVDAILFCILVQGAILLLGGAQPSVPLVLVAAFVFMSLVPVLHGCNQVIWQSKVAPDVMGKVLATKNWVTFATLPVAILVAGPLADSVFEPWLAPDGALAGTVGTIIGTGPGRGIGLLYIILGLIMIAGVTIAFQNRTLRNLEKDLPDAVSDEPGAGEVAAAHPAAGASTRVDTASPGGSGVDSPSDQEGCESR